MTQGKAKHTSEGKTEPKAHAVNPCAVAQLGIAQAVRPEPLYEGRGLQAPMKKTTTHGSGSQGNY